MTLNKYLLYILFQSYFYIHIVLSEPTQTNVYSSWD